MAHNQLGFNLLNRIHGYTYDNKQRRASKIERDAQTGRNPGHVGACQQIVKPGSDPGERLYLKAGNHKIR